MASNPSTFSTGPKNDNVDGDPTKKIKSDGQNPPFDPNPTGTWDILSKLWAIKPFYQPQIVYPQFFNVQLPKTVDNKLKDLSFLEQRNEEYVDTDLGAFHDHVEKTKDLAIQYDGGFVIVGKAYVSISAPSSEHLKRKITNWKTSPEAEDRRYTYKMLRNNAEVSAYVKGKGAKKMGTVKPPPAAVWVYRGVHKSHPWEDDGLRYVYCSENKRRPGFLSRSYIRLEDLELRINSAHYVIRRDYDLITSNTNPQCPFPAWDDNGTPVGPDEFEAMFDPGRSRSSKKLIGVENDFGTILAGFEGMLGVLMAAKSQPKSRFDVMARFWDDYVDPNVYDKKPFILAISNAVAEQIAKNSKILDVKPWLQKTVDAELNRLKTGDKCKFIPTITVEIDKSANELRADHRRIGSHPNGLYYLDFPAVQWSKLVTEAGGKLFKPPLQYKDNIEDNFEVERQKLAVLKRTTKNGYSTYTKEYKGTLTQVTSDKVDSVPKKRPVSQNQVMSNQRASEILNALFKPDVPGTQSNHRGEWLHRSAWSFGGLDISDKKIFRDLRVEIDKDDMNKDLHNGNMIGDEYSVQNFSNLVLGTYETNTMMLRSETFIKRYIENAKMPKTTDEDAKFATKMSMRTRLYHGTNSRNDFNRRGSSTWFGNFLLYQFTCPNPNLPKCEQTQIFHCFERRSPMRLEMMLDYLMEKVVYGWGANGEGDDSAANTAGNAPGDDGLEEEVTELEEDVTGLEEEVTGLEEEVIGGRDYR